MTPEVSIVVPCFNEIRYIEDCITSILNNGFDSDKLEILIVDGGSNDGTLEVLNGLIEAHSQVRILSNPQKITPISLNIGINAATGKYILISSAHAAFEKNYISILKSILDSQQDAIAVGGVMLTKVKHSNVISESIRTVLMHPVGVGNSKFRTGVKHLSKVDTVPFGLYHAALLKNSGGYDIRLIRNHDMELSKRLLASGGTIYLTPEASCTYFARETYREMARNNFNNGKWNLKTTWITKTFKSLSLRHFIPLLFLVAWSLPLVLTIFTHDYRWAVFSLGLITLYKIIISFISWKAMDGKNGWLQLVTAFLILHFSYGLGSLIGLLSIPFTPTKQ